MNISLKPKLIHTDATENEGLCAVSFRCRNQLIRCEFEDVEFLHLWHLWGWNGLKFANETMHVSLEEG